MQQQRRYRSVCNLISPPQQTLFLTPPLPRPAAAIDSRNSTKLADPKEQKPYLKTLILGVSRVHSRVLRPLPAPTRRDGSRASPLCPVCLLYHGGASTTAHRGPATAAYRLTVPLPLPRAQGPPPHANIVPTIGVALDGGVCTVSPLLSGGSLDSRLHDLSWFQRLKVAAGAFTGLEALHAAGLVHGNLKATNVLLPADGLDGGGLHSFTLQLNLSALCVTGGAVRG